MRNGLYSNAANAAAILSAMGNTKRLLILCTLTEKEMPVGALAEKLGLSQSALSQHLSKLRALNLVNTRRDAQTIYYSSSSTHVKSLLSTLESLYPSGSLLKHIA